MTADTPIYSFQDILRILEQNPELREAMRRYILDEELRQLPAAVRELRETVANLAQVVHDYMLATNARLDRLEAGQEELKAGQEELKAGQDRMEARQDRMEARQDRMEARQDRMEANQEEMKANQEEMKASQKEMKDAFARMERRQDRMEGHLNNLRGTEYERRAARRARRAAARWLNLFHATVVQAITVPDNNIIPNLMDDAVAANRVTLEQADDLELADLILAGSLTDAGDQPAYAVVEVSLAIDENDINRARERASALARASAVPVAVRPAVIGTAIPDDARLYADRNSVAVIIIPE